MGHGYYDDGWRAESFLTNANSVSSKTYGFPIWDANYTIYIYVLKKFSICSSNATQEWTCPLWRRVDIL